MNPIISKEQAEHIKSSGLYDKYIAQAKAFADSELKKDNPELTYSDFIQFKRTGVRAGFETKYFQKRIRFNAFALMYILFEEEKYKIALENSIWSLCCEYAWSVPAHIQYDMPFDIQNEWIDLFCSETGASIAEVLSIVGDRLDEEVVLRARNEIRRRIINPYLKHDYSYWWETSTNNWSAVCACGVGACLFYLGTPDEVDEGLPRLLKTMDCFLSGYNDDGCCMEGCSYWDYGFGMFVYFADLLKNYTDGKTDLFKNEKVHTIARFRQNIFIGRTKGISFSDAGLSVLAAPGLSNYLHDLYDDVVMIPEELLNANGCESHPRWTQYIRNFVWFKPEELPDGLEKPEYCFFKDAQWFIRNKKEYSIAAKGGHNLEPHNHNDLGSFIFIIDDDKVLDDYGCGRYTKQYFSDERYSFLVNSSRGHSVPIINGIYQKEGREYFARVIKSEKDCFITDLTKAYDDETLKVYTRKFDVTDDGMILTDCFEFSQKPSALTERFFTCIKPELKNGGITVGRLQISVPSDKYSIKITEEEFEPHSYTGENVHAYLIDFEVINPTESECLSFECTVV